MSVYYPQIRVRNSRSFIFVAIHPTSDTPARIVTIPVTSKNVRVTGFPWIPQIFVPKWRFSCIARTPLKNRPFFFYCFIFHWFSHDFDSTCFSVESFFWGCSFFGYFYIFSCISLFVLVVLVVRFYMVFTWHLPYSSDRVTSQNDDFHALREHP